MYLVGVLPDGDAEGAPQTEVRQLELQCLVDQQVLGLQVPGMEGRPVGGVAQNHDENNTPYKPWSLCLVQMPK